MTGIRKYNVANGKPYFATQKDAKQGLQALVQDFSKGLRLYKTKKQHSLEDAYFALCTFEQFILNSTKFAEQLEEKGWNNLCARVNKISEEYENCCLDLSEELKPKIIQSYENDEQLKKDNRSLASHKLYKKHVLFTSKQERHYFTLARSAEKVTDHLKDSIEKEKIKIISEQTKGFFLSHYCALIDEIARRYWHTIPLEDAFQYGFEGLIKAYERFDLKRNTRFTTYCLPWIKQVLSRALPEENIVRLPVHIHQRHINLTRYEKYEKPNEDEKTLHKTISSLLNPMSLDQPFNSNEETNLSLMSMISYEDPALNNLEKQDLYDKIRVVISSLPEREATIIKMRFGLDNGEAMKLEEVGNMLGVTRERIRQIESRALKKLKIKLTYKFGSEGISEIIQT